MIKQVCVTHQSSNVPNIAALQEPTLTVVSLKNALRILRMKQLIERTKLSRATLYFLKNTDPTFPKKLQLSTRAVGYLESDVDAWIAARVASSN